MDKITCIQIQIADGGEGLLKITWLITENGISGYPVEPYLIDRKALLANSENLRNALQTLVKLFLDEKTTENRDCLCLDELKKIARLGYKLYETLLNAREQDQRREIRQKWFDARKKCDETTLVIFHVKTAISVPWGVIFDSELVSDLNKNDLTHHLFQNFWCLNFQVATIWGNPAVGSKLPYVLSKKEDLALALDQDLIKNVCKLLDPNEVKYVEQIKEKYFVIKSLNDLSIKEDLAQTKNDLLYCFYFLCHSNETSLVINNTKESEIISFDDISKLLNKIYDNLKKKSFLFINGCSSLAERTEKGGFFNVGSFNSRGCLGLIGTEVKVPDVFATRFGFHFLSLWIGTGKNLGEVMQKMRKDHWPLSLVYGLCATPQLSISVEFSETNILEYEPQVQNLSTDRVSSGGSTI